MNIPPVPGGPALTLRPPVLAVTWTDWHSTTASSGLMTLGQMEPMTVTDVTRAGVELMR